MWMCVGAGGGGAVLQVWSGDRDAPPTPTHGQKSRFPRRAGPREDGISARQLPGHVTRRNVSNRHRISGGIGSKKGFGESAEESVCVYTVYVWGASYSKKVTHTHTHPVGGGEGPRPPSPPFKHFKITPG